MDESNRKDERRDSFLRKKKFKKIQGSSNLKETKRQEHKNLNSEISYEPKTKWRNTFSVE